MISTSIAWLYDNRMRGMVEWSLSEMPKDSDFLLRNVLCMRWHLSSWKLESSIQTRPELRNFELSTSVNICQHLSTRTWLFADVRFSMDVPWFFFNLVLVPHVET